MRKLRLKGVRKLKNGVVTPRTLVGRENTCSQGNPSLLEEGYAPS